MQAFINSFLYKRISRRFVHKETTAAKNLPCTDSSTIIGKSSRHKGVWWIDYNETLEPTGQ